MRLFLILSACFAATIAQAEPRCFEVSVTGWYGGPPSAPDVRALSEAIGNVVSQRKVLKYILRELPETGGFRACVEPVEPGGYDALVYEFSRIGVNNRLTHFEVTFVDSCTN